MTRLPATITIRPAYADDDPALARLAALDSADRAPERPLLLAEVDGRLRAAVAVTGDAAIADPFFPTAELIELLRVHAAASTPARSRSRVSPFRRLRRTALRPA